MRLYSVLSLLLFLSVNISLAQSGISVENLRLEYMKDPLGIDIVNPRFSWELSSSAKNVRQKYYQILVSTEPADLLQNKGVEWDSRKVAGNLSNQIYYKGRQLKANTVYYWKVRVWDQRGGASDWSAVGRFFVGPLTASDWEAQWIGEKEVPVPIEDRYYYYEGYRSEQSNRADVRKWVKIDLGTVQAIDAVKIYPIFKKESLFPLRFTIEAATQPDFSDAKLIVDESGNDRHVQSAEFYYKRLDSPVQGRYIRLNIIKLPLSDKEKKLYEFGISEWEVFSGYQNVALHKPVAVSDTLKLDHEYEAQWITDEFIKRSNKKIYSDHIPPSPLLRKEVQINKKVKHAFYSMSALGIYEAYINGVKVGHQVMAPEFTDYDSHLQYQTFDVTQLLNQGENSLGAELADGWYIGARWSFSNRGGYGFFRKFIGQLFIRYEDGSAEVIGTDGSWKVQPQGPVRQAGQFTGETYDAAYDQKGWKNIGFDDTHWKKVSAYPSEKHHLVAQMNEPLSIINELKPVSIKRIGSEKYVFDMGQNMVGWASINLPYNPGKPIRIRYAEVLYDDGTLYVDNLRGAVQINTYEPAGERSIAYEPKFTFHGFRFVEVEGLTQEPDLHTITGKVIASSSRVVSRFETSDDDINKLWSNIRWTLWGNLLSIPTDCPQRDEREGWMADAQVFSQTAIYNLDMAGFYTKWARDIRDSQLEDGRFPDISPHDGIWRAFFNAPGWADAGNIIPWRVYQNYNDKKILADQYDAMKKFVNFNHKNNPDLIWRKYRGNDYNDWLNGNWIVADDYPKEGGSVPNEVFATAYFAQSTQILSESAKLLGKLQDHLYYSKLAADIRDAFVKEFVSADGKIKGETQTGYAIALQFNILPEALRGKAAAQMVEAVKKYDGRISTGIHGTYMLMDQLANNGYTDLAYNLLLSNRFPSWMYSIDQGATTIWERWDGYVAGRGFQDAGMNSFNHVAIGAVGEWMYRHILGIQQDKDNPGFQHFFIKPLPGGSLTWAKGNYHSIQGDIKVSWEVKDDILTIDITVPANTSATVILPDKKERKIGSGQYQFTSRKK